MFPSPPELRRLFRPTPPVRPRPIPPPQCVNGDSFPGPEHLPLERNPSRALHWSPHSVVPNIGSSSRRPFAHSGCYPLCARPRPLASATTEARLSSQTPLTRFCNLSTRNPSTPTGDHSSHEELLSRPSLPDPTEVEPSCEQHGTGTSPFRKKPRLVPRRYLPYRPRRSELAVRAATQRPTRPRLEHPVVVDLPLREPEETRSIDWSTEASTLTARANGLGGPESRGAFESPRKPRQRRYSVWPGCPNFRRKLTHEVKAWGHPHAFFTSRLGRP